MRKAIDETRKQRPDGGLAEPPRAPARRTGLATRSRCWPLPPRQRAALTLRYVHDLPDDAIAKALGCRPATVRSLLSRGREALRDTLETDRWRTASLRWRREPTDAEISAAARPRRPPHRRRRAPLAGGAVLATVARSFTLAALPSEQGR